MSSVNFASFYSFWMPTVSPQLLKSFIRYQTGFHDVEYGVKLRIAVDNIDVLDLLPKVSAPTMVFHSIRDAMVSFQQGRRLSALLLAVTSTSTHKISVHWGESGVQLGGTFLKGCLYATMQSEQWILNQYCTPVTDAESMLIAMKRKISSQQYRRQLRKFGGRPVQSIRQQIDAQSQQPYPSAGENNHSHRSNFAPAARTYFAPGAAIPCHPRVARSSRAR